MTRKSPSSVRQRLSTASVDNRGAVGTGSGTHHSDQNWGRLCNRPFGATRQSADTSPPQRPHTGPSSSDERFHERRSQMTERGELNDPARGTRGWQLQRSGVRSTELVRRFVHSCEASDAGKQASRRQPAGLQLKAREPASDQNHPAVPMRFRRNCSHLH